MDDTTCLSRSVSEDNDITMDESLDYNARIEAMRSSEYPMLKDAVYLDHAGTTLYSKTLIESFSADMLSNLYGNPHSGSASSQLATRDVENIRYDTLRFLGLDPDHFDLVFVANATAGAKLVTEAFRDHQNGFRYSYHKDSHTSLVGIREVANMGHRCLKTDEEVESWLNQLSSDHDKDLQPALELFSYPAQSNMDGRRLPLHWLRMARQTRHNRDQHLYTLLDAAAFASSSSLNFASSEDAPDFIVLSFNKIFGFPDLGGLVVRKASASILKERRYFGGGTVDMVLCLDEQWHAKKSSSIHETLEDGTLPIHSIIALRSAMSSHRRCFGGLQHVSRHTKMLSDRLHSGLAALQHGNGSAVCEMHRKIDSGPIVSFVVRNAAHEWINSTEVEKLASIHSFHIRTGGLCNPGGIATALGIESWEMRANFSAGHRCGDGDDIPNRRPSGLVRLSLGAMSTIGDVDRFLAFMQEYFMEDCANLESTTPDAFEAPSSLFVESLTVYPIKSCAGWSIPHGVSWPVRAEGLGWDREWCIVHRGTGSALNQKRYPKMALIRPGIDFKKGVLRITYNGPKAPSAAVPEAIEVPLSADPRPFENDEASEWQSTICYDKVSIKQYKSDTITAFLTEALGVPCQLARFPSTTSVSSQRHAKPHTAPFGSAAHSRVPPLLCSNESPILTVSRSSLDRLNEDIKARGSRAVSTEAFRANIVVAGAFASSLAIDQAYAEDGWSLLKIGKQYYQMLGWCRRCQMVCIDQETAERRPEPFATLAKTRRFHGKVYFGRHTCHLPLARTEYASPGYASIRVGDDVSALYDGPQTRRILEAAVQ